MENSDNMTIGEYEAAAMRTALYPGHIGLSYTALGLAGEAGEVANKVKKVFRDHHAGISMSRRAGLSNMLSPGGMQLMSESDIRDLRAIINGTDINLSPEIRNAIADELGDVLWYVAAMCRELGLPMAYVAAQNIAKLNQRLAKGTLHGDGDRR